MTTGERRTRVDLPNPRTIVAEVDHEKPPPPLWRRWLRPAVVVVLLLIAAGLYLNSRYNPPPSPPNAATQQQLDKLRSDLDSYLAGRGGLRDQQYAKTVYTLCSLARTLNQTDILTDPDYDCAALLASPPPSVMTSTPPVTGASPSPSASATARATPTVTASPRPTAPTSTSAPTTASSAPSAAPTPTRTTAQPTPTPLLSGVLCNLPILTLCPGG